MPSRRMHSAGTLAAFGGPVIWALHFNLLYAVNALACARQFAHFTVVGVGIVPVIALLLTAIAAALIVLLWLLGESVHRASANAGAELRSAGHMLLFLSRWLNGISLIAVLWTLVPTLIVQPCG